MAWKGQEMTPSKKKLSYLYWVIEESKDELQKMLDKPGNSHAVSSRNDFIAGLDWKHTTKLQENEHMCKPRGDLIILRTGNMSNFNGHLLFQADRLSCSRRHQFHITCINFISKQTTE